MSVRLSQLCGLPAVLGRQVVGCVEQAMLTRDGRALRGLILRRGMGAAKWSPAAQVRLIGQASVILSAPPVRVPPDADFALTSVLDTGGLRLGRVTDVWLDPDTLLVTALEISLGALETMRGGRLVARTFTPHPVPDDPGQVLLPCGMPLEHARPAARR